MSNLIPKVAFLGAITSVQSVSKLVVLRCKEAFEVLHKGKVVLRPKASFLPKVVSAFHLNQDIVHPSLCPAPRTLCML